MNDKFTVTFEIELCDEEIAALKTNPDKLYTSNYTWARCRPRASCGRARARPRPRHHRATAPGHLTATRLGNLHLCVRARGPQPFGEIPNSSTSAHARAPSLASQHLQQNCGVKH